MKLRFWLGLSVGLWLTGCQGNPLGDRLAINPGLQVSPGNVTTPSPAVSPTALPSASPQGSPTVTASGQVSEVTNLDTASRQALEDLAQLGIIPSPTDPTFQPHRPITRREFARWLFTANNRFFADLPGKQIRQASPSSNATFTDVPKTDADFGRIQGLADAGLIPSPLSNDPSASAFRPNAPLTREDLLIWKVPLDVRRALPNASLDNLKETWGFQDVAKINPRAWRAIYADFQNGDQANIRRIFGYTTLFQPQKAVTQAEAAIALSYLGSQGDGLSAQDVLTRQTAPTPSPSPSPLLSPSPQSPPPP
jgi:hypothetical protein